MLAPGAPRFEWPLRMGPCLRTHPLSSTSLDQPRLSWPLTSAMSQELSREGRRRGFRTCWRQRKRSSGVVLGPGLVALLLGVFSLRLRAPARFCFLVLATRGAQDHFLVLTTRGAEDRRRPAWQCAHVQLGPAWQCTHGQRQNRG